MRKIRNSWNGLPGYNCYGCCPDNPHGLKMQFFEDGEDIVSIWHPTHDSQGWINVLHGGIQATLCDEIASWVIFRKLQTSGVTAKMEVRYRKPVSTLDDHITLRARLSEQRRNMATIEIELFNASDELCTSTTCVYFVQKREQALADGFQSFELEDLSVPSPACGLAT